MTRHFKLVAAVAVVLVTLSGFSPARSSGGSSSGGSSSSGSSSSGSSGSGSSGSGSSVSKSSGGGGCSSSSSRSHNSYGSGSGHAQHDSRDSRATGTLLKCAADGAGEPAATVRVKNPGETRTVDVEVDFLDGNGGFVDTGSTRVTVRRDGTKKVRVAMEQPKLLDEVEECRVLSVR